jgi:hypothetical protein
MVLSPICKILSVSRGLGVVVRRLNDGVEIDGLASPKTNRSTECLHMQNEGLERVCTMPSPPSQHAATLTSVSSLTTFEASSVPMEIESTYVASVHLVVEVDSSEAKGATRYPCAYCLDGRGSGPPWWRGAQAARAATAGGHLTRARR